MVDIFKFLFYIKDVKEDLSQMKQREKYKILDRKLIWHPFTQRKEYKDIEIPIITKAKGLKLYDIEGNLYYDTISSWWTNSIGHCNKHLIKSIYKQLKKLDHTIFAGFTHIPAIELCEKIKNLLPHELTKFFFSDNGSTAVEVALKIAFQYWEINHKKKEFFAFLDNSYHGDTIGSMSVGGIESYNKIFKPLMFKSLRINSPDCSNCRRRKSEFTFDAGTTNCDLDCFKEVEEEIVKNHEKIYAFIVEPLLQAASGMKIYPVEYLKKLRELTKKYNILLILDEVATGFGRTGSMFAFEKAGIVPDILCLSKALGGGILPLGLTITNEKIYNAFYGDYFSNKTFFHGHSYTAYPASCAVAKEHINYLVRNELPQSNQESFEYFYGRLKNFMDWDKIGDIRFIGSIGAIDIVKSRKLYINYPIEKRIGFKIFLEGLKNNLILRPLGNTIYWFLPINIKKKEIEKIMKLSEKVLRGVLND